MSANTYDVAIIGAGLSGLTSAVLLKKAGHSVVVLEASDRIGGRIQSLENSDGDRLADLGPSWVWPSFQPIAKQWLEFLELPLFDQYEMGKGILELDPESEVKKAEMPGQEGIARIVGGPKSAIEKLAETLGAENIRFDAKVAKVSKDLTGIALNLEDGKIEIRAKRLICSIPPRVAAASIDWGDLVGPDLRSTLENTPTWMATQAKVVAVYDKPFWRKKGLSGRVASHVGPLVEIHDHCNENTSTAALFGFVGLNHQQRAQYSGVLPGLIMKQLMRCFGPEAASPIKFEIADWAQNSNICSELDKNTPAQHPQVMPEIIRKPHADGKLFFGAAETAAQSPGLIEGAFVAGTWAARGVISAITTESAHEKTPH